MRKTVQKRSWFYHRRIEMNLSQGDILHKLYQRGLHYSIGAVSGWDRGQVPGIELVPDLAAIYEVTEAEILDAMNQCAKDRKPEDAAAK